MMRIHLALLLAGAAACGGTGSAPRDPTPGTPMTRDDHLAEANRKDAEAVQLDERADESAADPDAHGYACGDTVAADQVTSGGERLITQSNCWPTGEDPDDLRDRAKRLRQEADEHRRQARE
jgi:hypothetical protein